MRWGRGLAFGGGTLVALLLVLPRLFDPRSDVGAVLLLVVTLALAGLAFAVGAGVELKGVRVPVRGPEEWRTVRSGQWDLRTGAHGLPVLGWRESSLAEPQICRVVVGADGACLFQFERGHDPGYRRGLDDMDVMTGAAKIADVVRHGVPRFERVLSAPWAALEGFEMTDEQRHLGHVQRSDDGKEVLPPRDMLLARFADGIGPWELSTGTWRRDALAQLHGILLREFIEARPAHMARLAGRGGSPLSEAGPAARPTEL